MKNSGIFSSEAGLACLLFVLLALPVPLQGGPRPNALLAQQKLQDLLLVWEIEGTAMQDMEKDANFFLGGGYALEIDGRKISGGLVRLPMGRGGGKIVSARIITRTALGGARIVKLSIAP